MEIAIGVLLVGGFIAWAIWSTRNQYEKDREWLRENGWIYCGKFRCRDMWADPKENKLYEQDMALLLIRSELRSQEEERFAKLAFELVRKARGSNADQ